MTTKNELLKHQREEHGFNFCERCKKNRQSVMRIDEHHIILRSEKPKHPEMDNARNKILVCSDCHDWYHEIKSRRNELIEQRNLTELFGTNIIR